MTFAFCLLSSPSAAANPTPAPVPAVTPRQSTIDLVNRANALYSRGEFAKALILYRKAEARGADLGTISFNIGNCLYRLNELPEAAAAFKKTERLTDGKYLPALFNLAAVLFRLEQYGESIAAYRRALRGDPENASAWLYLADAYGRTKDYVGALQALEKARALDPEDLSVVYQMAETHAAMKEYPAAIALVREAYARKPAEVDFVFYIGDLYRSQGDLEGAAGAYREGLALREKDPETLYKLADVLAQDKKPFLAMEYLQKALAYKPEFTDAAVFLGNLAFDAKWWDRAEASYLQALRAGNREGLEGLRNLAYEYHSQGRNDRASQVLEGALPIRPNDKGLAEEVVQYRALEKDKRPAAPQ
ncbi:MAG TPA: tetratricopeptide repeat protein [Fibrobacteria bacterium]|nr:tetratricopeptide repeat protein [Fibrobacteria bacterium]